METESKLIIIIIICKICLSLQRSKLPSLLEFREAQAYHILATFQGPAFGTVNGNNATSVPDNQSPLFDSVYTLLPFTLKGKTHQNLVHGAPNCGAKFQTGYSLAVLAI